MTVFPARKPIIAASDKALVPVHRDPRPETHLTPRITPAEWARRRRAQREARRIEAAGSRAIARVEHLGPSWHIVDWPRTSDWPQAPRREQAGFLAIGPGGVFAVTVADHGRTRVLIAGDVVQINGRRPAYVAEARREAKQAEKMLSEAVGHKVPVVPVLTFVGNGVISVYGLPKDCLIAAYQDLDRLLIAGGARISARTAEKLSQVARHPATWLVDRYKWYTDGQTVAQKAAAGR
jgi:hypothetical protein